MQISDLIFEVRDASFNRVAQLNPGIDGLTTFKATTRFNNVGSWELTIPETVPDAALLSAPGAGLVVTGPNGVLFSGPVVSATNTRASGSPIGEWSVKGATDTIILGEHLAYPTPSTADVTAQTSAYDSASGVASTVMYGYVTRNLISGATARKVTGLSCATDTAIGSSVSFSARFQTLGELLTTIANVSNPVLGFDVKQVGTGLVFSVYQPTDKSKTIRMSTDTGTLSKTSYGYGYGKTRAIVGGMGQLTARQFVEVTTSGSTAAEAAWSRRVEVFVDQNNESDSTKLTQAGKDALADQGNITSVEVTPSSDSTMEFGVDWGLGDTVTVVIGGQEVSAIVSQATMTVSEDGVRIGATVGTPTGFDFDAILMKRQTDTSSDVSSLQLKETGGTATLVPAGGAANTVLAKTSATDYATGWTQIADANVATGAAIANSKLAASGVIAGTYPKVTVNDRGIVTGASASIANSDLANSSITINGTAVSLGGTRTVSASELTSGTLPMAQGGSGGTTGSGLVPVIPSSVAVGSGSASVSSAGVVTFSTASSISLNGCFSSTYSNYRIVWTSGGSAGNVYMQYRLRTTTDDTSTNYNSVGRFWYGTTGGNGDVGLGGQTATILGVMNPGGVGPSSGSIDLYNPATTGDYTRHNSQMFGGNSSYGVGGFQTIGVHFVASSFTGITFFPGSGTLTGTIQVYGYRNS